MSSTDVNAVLAKLTLEEKISLLAGANFWETVPIASKGVPALKVSDGPNGARGGTFSGGVTSACFPAACSVASTFDVDIARRIGVALGEETHTKGARVLLAPTVCIHRHPLGGRNFESFSEDPFLAGKLAARVIEGVQSEGVSATIKHFVANEQETRRLSVNTIVGERALREIYLKPFEIAIKEAKPGAVMTSYNLINGTHADSSPLLKDVLRGDWGWDGLVMSDWGGVNSTLEALEAGTDLEMPGPTQWRKIEAVAAAVRDGRLSSQTIDERALRVLRFLQRQDCFEDATISEEKAVDRPEHRALIREAGGKGIVLLKNEGAVLPLSKDRLKGRKVAILGYADECLAHGGGSAAVNAHYKSTPLDALREALGEDVEVTYAKGAPTFRQLPLLTDNVVGLDGSHGFTYLIYSPGNPTPVKTIHGHGQSEVSLIQPVYHDANEAELVGTFTAPETGTYYLTLSGMGPSQLLIDGQIVYDQPANCPDFMGFLLGGVAVPFVPFQLQAGTQYKLQIRSRPPTPDEGADIIPIFQHQPGVRLGLMTAAVHDQDLLPEAVELAKAADVAIVFTGHAAEWETEGQDQASFHLPKNGSQDRLVAAVAAVNSQTVVVNSTGVAVAMPWLDQVQALVQSWFPGQEAGHSIADVLVGARNPEGHLTCTFPRQIEDSPAYGNFPGTYDDQNRLTVTYAEGVFVGYRHYDRLAADKVNFPFGFGLSYTAFSYVELAVSPVSPDEYNVRVTVANTGAVQGATAVQIYVGGTVASAETPVKTLASFKKITLQAGESTVVELPVKLQDVASWDEKTHRWSIQAGDYKFSVGKNARDMVLSVDVHLEAKTYLP
ncbi:glycoside hydrolase family 3 domain containing protein [Grosmannia clavigera kw1407]|uniref:beta-glucosidase n=1 Tax=Grosmannia clavigera (strain kw1407 / UAMH 11150) TaxID=655863 RepID=F0XBE0_GROCL|nr:glycoside hydrolase family 3 domain containing protein [Grosmannia clavigera kw1407]EFX05115.1 glycoside hydrolase family 3 domain containing protein [Grosmannia clavigera kw1407]